MTHDALIALGCGLAVLLAVAVARYRRSNHGTHRAPGHRADPFAGVEPGDYDWRDEDPDIGTMTFTGPMPKITGDTYDLPGWEPLRPLPVQTVNLPPWEMENDHAEAHLSRGRLHAASAPPDVHVPNPLVRTAEVVPGRDLGDVHAGSGDHEGPEPGVSGRGDERRELPRWTQLAPEDLPDLVSDPEMDRPRRGPGDGSQVRQPDLPGAAADVMVGDHRAGEAVSPRRRYTWTSLFGTPDPMPDPQNLPAQGPEGARDTGQSPLGGEPVIEGVVVSHVLADTWLQDQLEQLRAWSDSHCQQLEAWSQLEVAA